MDSNMLYPTIAAIIGLIIGYFLGKSSKKTDSTDISELKQRNLRLQNSLDECRDKQTARGPSAASTSSSFANSFATKEKSLKDTKGQGSDMNFDANKAKAIFGKRVKENDLTIVEGIGPKTQALFHNHDVKTWQALADSSVAKCKEVLDSGGNNFKMHNPGTWPKQSKMAADGRWQELFEWQEKLDGGK